jgi:hypothetical protein
VRGMGSAEQAIHPRAAKWFLTAFPMRKYSRPLLDSPYEKILPTPFGLKH